MSAAADGSSDHHRIALRWSLGLPLGSAIVGSLVTAAMFQGRVNVLPDTISYTDLAAVVLTAVTIILAVVALALAAMAIVGWRAFLKMAEIKAREAALPAATGAIERYVATSAEQLLISRAEAVALRVISPARIEQLIQERVDALLAGNPADAELDEEEAEDRQAEQLGQDEGGENER